MHDDLAHAAGRVQVGGDHLVEQSLGRFPARPLGDVGHVLPGPVLDDEPAAGAEEGEQRLEAGPRLGVEVAGVVDHEVELAAGVAPGELHEAGPVPLVDAPAGSHPVGEAPLGEHPPVVRAVTPLAHVDADDDLGIEREGPEGRAPPVPEADLEHPPHRRGGGHRQHLPVGPDDAGLLVEPQAIGLQAADVAQVRLLLEVEAHAVDDEAPSLPGEALEHPGLSPVPGAGAGGRRDRSRGRPSPGGRPRRWRGRPGRGG